MTTQTAGAEELQPQTLGAMIDELYELRRQMRDLTTTVSDLRVRADTLEEAILANLDSQDLRLSRGRQASASVTEQTVAQIEDWDAVYRYISENDAFHLMEKRVANAAYRELLESGETIPGTTPFTKRGLSIRKA